MALTLMLGLVGAIVLLAAEGARRTDTAYRRMLAVTNAPDVLFGAYMTGMEGLYDEVAALPEVAGVGIVAGIPLVYESSPGQTDNSFVPNASVDGQAFYRIGQPKVLAGRLPRPEEEDEVLVSRSTARRLSLNVGDTVTLRHLTRAEFETDTLIGPDGPRFTFTVVGIGLTADEIVPAFTAYDQFGMMLTPAWFRAHADPTLLDYDGAFVKLQPGANVGLFRQRLEEVASRHPEAGGIIFTAYDERHAEVQRSISPLAVTLWVLAIVSGAAAVIVVGQALSRQVVVFSGDHQAFRALGMTRGQLMLVAVLPAAGAALTGGLLAVVAAGLGSPLSPVGVARLAEPHPGMAPNVGLLLSGLALLVALLLIPIALPAWRAVSRPPGGARAGLLDPARRSRLAEAARRRLSPAAGSGVGMALESVPGPRRAPVKAPMVTGVVAVGAVVAALCVLASLDHLLTRPRSFGWGWDITVDGQFGALDSDDVLATLSALDGVAGVAGGDYGNLTIGGRAVPAVGLDQLQGQVFPTLLEGRAATAPDEIVLGTTTMRRAHTSVGRKLSVQFEDVTRQLTVVGRAVFPPLGRGGFSPSGLGVGAAVTAAALAPQDLPEGSYNFVAVRAAPDADVGALAEMLGRARTDWGCPTAETCFVVRTPRPAELDAYAAVRWSPSLLAGLLAILAVFTLGHSLVSSVRRRRRDLAVLKTLGFVRSQVSASVAWQATTFAGIAVLFGLPLGLVAGRWAWSTFARGLGVDPTVATPLLAVALTVPLALIAANLMAAIPARTAGATRPATALRSE